MFYYKMITSICNSENLLQSQLRFLMGSSMTFTAQTQILRHITPLYYATRMDNFWTHSIVTSTAAPQLTTMNLITHSLLTLRE